MEYLDLTAYRPGDSAWLLGAWQKLGLTCACRNQAYLPNAWLTSAPGMVPTADGNKYFLHADFNLHLKRSDKAKVHWLALVIEYTLYDRDLAYKLEMRSCFHANLDAVPVEFPMQIFPYRGESVYETMLEVYRGFYARAVRPFLGVRHSDLHTDIPDEELAFV